MDDSVVVENSPHVCPGFAELKTLKFTWSNFMSYNISEMEISAPTCPSGWL